MINNKYYNWYKQLDEDKRELIKEFIPKWLNGILDAHPDGNVVVTVGNQYQFELHVDVLEAPNE